MYHSVYFFCKIKTVPKKTLPNISIMKLPRLILEQPLAFSFIVSRGFLSAVHIILAIDILSWAWTTFLMVL